MGSRPMRTLFCSLLAVCLFGEDWPQFRGVNGSGLCDSCGRMPTEFGPGKNVLWKTVVPAAKRETQHLLNHQAAPTAELTSPVERVGVRAFRQPRHQVDAQRLGAHQHVERSDDGDAGVRKFSHR